MVECIGGEWMEGMNGKEINEVKESRGRKVDEGKSEERWMVGKWVLEEEEEAGGGKEGETISYNIPSPFLASAFAKSFTLFSIKFVLIIESDTKHNKSF